jgi:hypothetical protein
MSSAKTGEQQHYLDLFEFIDVQDSLNNRQLNEWASRRSLDRQLPVIKNQLIHLIYRDLRNYHKSSRKAEVKDILRNVEILYNKELYVHCKKEVQRAERIATQYELIIDLHEIENWKKRLHQNEFPTDYVGLEKILSKQGESLEKIQNKHTYNQLILDVTKALSNGSQDKVLNEELLKDPGNAQTMEAMVMHYNAGYFRFIQSGESDTAKSYLQELIGEMEEAPMLLSEDPALYMASLNNLISYTTYNRSYDESLQYIQKVKLFASGNKITSENRNVLRQLLRTLNIELEIMRVQIESYSSQEFETMEDYIKKYEFKMPKEYVISFWFQFANIHFMRKDFKRSLFWINEILNSSRFKDTRRDIQGFARILNLMIHLEQKNLFVMRYFVDSTRRFLRKQKGIEPYEKLILQFFSKVGKSPLFEHSGLYRSLHDNLFPESGDWLLSKQVLDYIDFKRWIEDKLKM